MQKHSRDAEFEVSKLSAHLNSVEVKDLEAWKDLPGISFHRRIEANEFRLD
jgi:hypothetical protein